jgi:ribonuclease HII
MTHLIGIDDAGRGPVIGPMILAGVLIDNKEESILKELGAKDSKLLSPTTRNKIGNEIKSKYKYHIEKSSPEDIDSCENLNTLEAMKAAMIINQLTEKIKEEVDVIIDCPSVNTKEWKSTVEKFLNNKEKIKIKAEHKADFNYPVVSAASIIAKESREEEVAKLKKELQIDFGSGYPADPKTIEFIEKNYADPIYSKIIRHSWSTVKKLKTSQKKLF